MRALQLLSLRAFLGIAAVAWTMGLAAHAQNLHTLYTFPGGASGANPTGTLVRDSSGNLYGVTSYGGIVNSQCADGCGTVFEVSPSTSGWTESVIYSFTGANGDGYFPWGLAADAAGNLYGVTEWGGSSNSSVNCVPLCGTVFKLSPGASGWSYQVIHSFQGGSHDGAFPATNIVLDKQGNIYGTTSAGGIGVPACYGAGCGTVWELSPTASGAWKEKIIHNFLGMGYGAFPHGLTIDVNGNIYGATWYGGNAQQGTVYKLSPTKNGWIGGVIYRMPGGTDGFTPYGVVAVDSKGNVYGSTWGLSLQQYGVVFELTPTKSGWTEQVLYSFAATQSQLIPTYGVTVDAAGNVYGTNNSSVFELSDASGSWNFTTLANFGGVNEGSDPAGAVIFDAAGNMYGTTWAGQGTAKEGTVFEITP